MKYTALFLFALLGTLAASAQQMVKFKTENMEVTYRLSDNAKFEITADKLTFTDGKTEASFSPDERVVLFVKKNDTTTGVQGDVNGDTQVTISDVTKLVDILLEKKD